MSYDGSGTYTPPSPEYPAVAGSLIKSADFNGIVTDIAAALSLALVRDGRAPMTGDLSLGIHKITNVVNGANPQDATTVLQVFTSPTFSNPTLTGVPVGPTAAPGTDTTQLATTAFVQHPDSPAITGTPTAPTAAPDTSTTQLATTAFVTTADNLKAPLASPALTGVPTAPTAPTATDNTQLATTEFVQNVAMNSALPGQAGHTGELLLTDGTDAAWGPTYTGADRLFLSRLGTTVSWQYAPTSIYTFETAGGF